MGAYYENELYHFGVKGMKWGVRKKSYYQNMASYNTNKANKAIQKIGTSKTRLGKNYQNLKARNYEVTANKYNSMANNGSIRNRISNNIGSANTSNRLKANSNYYKRKSEQISKTKLNKQINKSRSYTAESYAKALDNYRNAKGIRDKASKYIDFRFKTEVKTWSGRKTTSGKAIVESMPYLNTIVLAKDVSYYRKNRKNI